MQQQDTESSISEELFELTGDWYPQRNHLLWKVLLMSSWTVCLCIIIGTYSWIAFSTGNSYWMSTTGSVLLALVVLWRIRRAYYLQGLGQETQPPADAN